MHQFLVTHFFSLSLTNGPDDSLLQLPLLMSLYDLGTNVGAAIIATSQLIVDAKTELPQQSVEHLQHCRTCRNKQWPIINSLSYLNLGVLFSLAGQLVARTLHLTHRSAGCYGGCLQQDLHDTSSHRGWVLTVGVQVTEKLLDYQVRMLGLQKRRK